MKTFLLVVAILSHGKLTQYNQTIQVEPNVDKCPFEMVEKKLKSDKRARTIADYSITCAPLPGWGL
jgi:hypothetical protein